MRKRLFTRGGAGSLALPLTSPQSGPGAPRPHPARPLEVTWWGGVQVLSSAELPDRPGRRGLDSRDPPAAGKLLPSIPHGSQAPRRQSPLGAQSRGIPRVGGSGEKCPAPSTFL